MRIRSCQILKLNMDIFPVTEAQRGTRLDKFLITQRPELSRSFLQSLIENGNIRVNDAARKANYTVKTGDSVTLEIPPPSPATARAEEIPLDVLYEDDGLLVINKPAGMVVHPAVGHTSGTLVNAVLGYAPEIVTGNEERPGIVHRLDRDTSGVMLIAKNDVALHELQRQFAAREIHKIYIALVNGMVSTPQGKIDAPIARDTHDRKKMTVYSTGHAREAVTVFYVLAHTDKYTLLRLEPETGRTHQIRVHLAFLKHPVVADEVYGKKKNDLGLERQFLHARRITFRHPITHQEMTFTAPLPPELTQALERTGIPLSAIDN